MTEKHTRRGFMGLLAAVGLAPAALTKEPHHLGAVERIEEPVLHDVSVVPKVSTKPWTSRDTKLVVKTDPPIVLKEIVTVEGPATPRETISEFPKYILTPSVEVEFLGENRAVFDALGDMSAVPFELQFSPPSHGVAGCTVEFEAYVTDVTVTTHMDHSYTKVRLVLLGEASWTYA